MSTIFNDNIIFGRQDSQIVCKNAKLLIPWCALKREHIDIGGFILCCVMEVAKTTHYNVITWCVVNEEHIDIEAFIRYHLVKVAKTTCNNMIGMAGWSPL